MSHARKVVKEIIEIIFLKITKLLPKRFNLLIGVAECIQVIEIREGLVDFTISITTLVVS